MARSKTDPMEVLEDAQNAELEERKAAKAAKQLARKAKRAEMLVKAPAIAVPAKMVKTTFAEIKEKEIFPEIEVVLPDELLALDNDPKFIAKQMAADLREQAFQALDEREGKREILNTVQTKLDSLHGRYVGIHKRFWDKWVETHPGTAKWINSSEPSCVAHKNQVDKFIDLAAAKIDDTVSAFLKLKAELADTNAWLQDHGADHLALFAKAEKACADAGVDYFKIWPMKDKTHAKA